MSTRYEKQLVTDEAVAELWGQAPELMRWADYNADLKDPHEPLAEYLTAVELAEELAECHEVTAQRYRSGGVEGTAKAHDRLARAARQLGAHHLNMIALERAMQAHFKRGCRRTAGVERGGK